MFSFLMSITGFGSQSTATADDDLIREQLNDDLEDHDEEDTDKDGNQLSDTSPDDDMPLINGGRRPVVVDRMNGRQNLKTNDEEEEEGVWNEERNALKELASDDRLRLVIKRQPTIYAKNSFDRYGDDLCQLLLSYLRFEEKFRFESISKQWQRVVFASLTVLSIDDNSGRRILPKTTRNAFQSILQSLKTRIESTFGHKFAKSEYNWTLFETIVKKCTNISSIDLPLDCGLEDKAIDLLIKYCPQFTGIADDFECVSDQMSDKFITQFGPQLLRINPLVSFSAKQLEKSTQLETIYLDFECKPFSSANLLTETQYTFTRLTRIDILMNNTTEMDTHLESLTAFVGRYGTQLKVFALYFGQMSINSTINKLVPIMAQMSALISLRLMYDFWLNDWQQIPILRTISVNCRRVKSLAIDMMSFSPELMDTIAECFPRLTRLSITVIFDMTDLITCQSLSPLKRLTHLDIKTSVLSMDYWYFTDTFFANIGHNLPNLQYLNVYYVKITEASFISFSGLRQIRGITLTGDTEGWEQDMSEMRDNLYTNCPKLCFIDLKTDLFDD